MAIQHVLEPMEHVLEFKPAFVERYKKLLGEEGYAEFYKYSTSYQKRAIRVNTLKASVEQVKKRLEKDWELEAVPWCDFAFWILHRGVGEEHRRDVGNLLEHSLGYIYIQEPASMVPPLALDPQPGELILDMCAAPGSKTTQIIQQMNNTGLVVANEYIGSRLAPLAINTQRLGSTNVVCTKMDGNRIRGLAFDRILVDAPCSGVGTISKSMKTVQIWNPNMIRRLAKTQLRLLNNAYRLIKPGGTVVYSTCTTEPEEDEGVVSSFLEEHPDMELQNIDLNIERSQPFQEFEGRRFHPDISRCLRIWPQDNDTEGFFVAKFIKN
ncbi:MAG: RsmB/NOP family class I SAM-dependent RNA methyltransferase [Nanoarchaeota archaeon]